MIRQQNSSRWKQSIHTMTQQTKHSHYDTPNTIPLVNLALQWKHFHRAAP